MMFHAGDLVVYGATGVCQVEDVSPPASGADASADSRLFYRLNPLHHDGVIYTPAENGKVPIRPVMSAQEAQALIDEIPSIHAVICRAPTTQALAQHYQAVVRSHNCREIAEMMISIYAKRQQAQAQNRRLGAVDERYMKQAEVLLYGELAAALQIPFNEMESYIAHRVEDARPAAASVQQQSCAVPCV